MSGHEPGAIDRLIGASLKIMAAAIAIFVAIALIQEIIWWLVGITIFVSVAWVGVVVVRTLRERW
ncbi:hypothetical protein V7968_16320 [Nocardia vulneris]|uniref:hypothetical protein n=1 Tax=Nocardia vulneris TaxID=1141657 RepID=UPI0030D0A51C